MLRGMAMFPHVPACCNICLLRSCLCKEKDNARRYNPNVATPTPLIHVL